jgi:hypothetical protein
MIRIAQSGSPMPKNSLPQFSNSRPSLWTAIGRIVDPFIPDECRNYFAAADTMQRDRLSP